MTSHLELRIARRRAELDAQLAANGGDHPDTLRAQHRLAHAYRAARRFDEALRWFDLAAEGSARALGPDHLETLRYRSSLANCHYAAGHTDVAIEMFAALFDARRAALGEEHPDTLRSRGSLANALHAVGRYDEAATLHLRNAGDRAETLGRQHPVHRGQPPQPGASRPRRRRGYHLTLTSGKADSGPSAPEPAGSEAATSLRAWSVLLLNRTHQSTVVLSSYGLGLFLPFVQADLDLSYLEIGILQAVWWGTPAVLLVPFSLICSPDSTPTAGCWPRWRSWRPACSARAWPSGSGPCWRPGS